MKYCPLFMIAALVALELAKASSVKRPKCNNKIDLAIVIDASASMGEENFAKSKAFARDLLSHFDISEEATHVSLSYFSFYTHLVTAFDDEDSSVATMYKELKKMRYEGSFTNLAKTATGLRYKVFSKDRGARKGQKDSKMVAVFLSDGFESMGPDEISFCISELHNYGVETFAGIVDGENSNEGIDSLVSPEKKDHKFTMYNDPKKRKIELERMVQSICKIYNKPKETIADTNEAMEDGEQ
ncbi:von Willebrand factor A domain-containing protein 2 [Exaiptasia diaphana]|uniref:VWFA domain-containing protein n=1 Tax=Exaiptasia diaphana TaxID=2652724 RepID=A0A913X381_EXADI|nr:von Willebrand factor A domain-containing protein 2 [Exaiptasia diaphana]XP_028514170.1 von Willebrand factor A domain-containing protein 2 [Exaiptasia diaphana]KXJ15928.1 Collagen alpha-1(XII) chain [Exaiptasia diaphana]